MASMRSPVPPPPRTMSPAERSTTPPERSIEPWTQPMATQAEKKSISEGDRANRVWPNPLRREPDAESRETRRHLRVAEGGADRDRGPAGRHRRRSDQRDHHDD